MERQTWCQVEGWKRKIERAFTSFFSSGPLLSINDLPSFDWRGKRASTRCWRGGRERRIGEASSCQWSEPSSQGPSPPRERCTSACGSGWGWAAPRRQLLLQIWRRSVQGSKKSGQLVPARPEPRMSEIHSVFFLTGTSLNIPRTKKLIYAKLCQCRFNLPRFSII